MSGSISKNFEDSKTILSRYFLDENNRYDLLKQFMFCITSTLIVTALGLLFGWYGLPAIYAAFIAKNAVLLVLKVLQALAIITGKILFSYIADYYKSQISATWAQRWQADLLNMVAVENDLKPQIISDYVPEITSSFLNFLIGLIENLLNLVIYTVLLILVGGSFTFTVFDIKMMIPCFLVFVAFALGISSALITSWINQGLQEVSTTLSRKQANFRTYLEKFSTDSNATSLTDEDANAGNRAIKTIHQFTLKHSFIENTHHAFELLCNGIQEIIPYLCSAPMYFNATLTLETFLSASYYFSWINYSIAGFISSWPQLIQLMTKLEQVMELYKPSADVQDASDVDALYDRVLVHI